MQFNLKEKLPLDPYLKLQLGLFISLFPNFSHMHLTPLIYINRAGGMLNTV